MFEMRECVKDGLMKAIGSMADYKILLSAAGWCDKGVLTEGDLAEIHAAINARSNDHEVE